MQMILFGSSIVASEAKSHGLVAETFDKGTVLENAIALASQLAQLSPGAVSLAKEAIGRCTFPMLDAVHYEAEADHNFVLYF